MKRRRPIGDTETFALSLVTELRRLRDEVRSLPPGHARESALGKLRQSEARAHIYEWLRPGQAPK